MKKYNLEFVHYSDDNISATANIPIVVANSTVNNINDHNEGNPVDIKSWLGSLIKGFSNLTLSQLDKLVVDLFHLFETSNPQMNLFDCIIT